MMRTSTGREYDENLSQIKDLVTKGEDRVLQLHKSLEATKSCAELGHFDMANESFREFTFLKRN
jgi:hypothetical protein